MLKVNSAIKPPADTLVNLKLYQDDVNKEVTFGNRVSLAKKNFSKYNKKKNKVFDAIKASLLEISPGIERCAYCEDSKCDEVEHIHPKDFYPELCFTWENYVYACGTCNGPKNNLFALYDTSTKEIIELNKLTGNDLLHGLPAGEKIFIDPRIEDPFDYCTLDLRTFLFNITAQANTFEYIKAEYTFNQVLRLNTQREYLRLQREQAYDNYKNRLIAYKQMKDAGATPEKLQRIIANLKREGHPTVWKEIQRQHRLQKLSEIDTDFDKLLITCPEALLW